MSALAVVPVSTQMMVEAFNTASYETQEQILSFLQNAGDKVSNMLFSSAHAQTYSTQDAIGTCLDGKVRVMSAVHGDL